MGPLDHIVQATGCCNREGRLYQGSVTIFHPAKGRVPRGDYRSSHNIARAMLTRPSVDLHSPEIYESYFRQLYQGVNTDKHGIMNCANLWIFLRWPPRFKLIDEGTVPLVVRYSREVSLVNDLLRHLQTPGALLGGEARLLLRRLHPVKDLNDVAIDPETLVI